MYVSFLPGRHCRHDMSVAGIEHDVHVLEELALGGEGGHGGRPVSKKSQLGLRWSLMDQQPVRMEPRWLEPWCEDDRRHAMVLE